MTQHDSTGQPSGGGSQRASDGRAPASNGSPDVGRDAPNIDWQAALEEHGRWLRTIVIARVGSPHALDEVMQEVALAAVRQAAPISDASKVAPWLYRLAVTQSLLYRRKMGRQRKLIDRFAERYQPRESDNRSQDPLQWLLADERRLKVRQALDTLKGRDAEILLLKYTENWSYKQIAQQLGITQSAVESRLHRARARLRDKLLSMDVIDAK